jgi:hypothetical protein
MISKQVFGVRFFLLSAMMFLYSVPVFSETSGPDINQEGQSLVDINLHFLQQKKSANDWGRDPFLLPAVPKKRLTSDRGKRFSLSAIIYKEGSGAAIINNQITRRGDQIGGMAVHEIQPDRVILKNELEVLELRVDPFTLR